MDNLKFTRTHEWLQPDGPLALVGITAHAQSLLGDMVFIEMPSVGTQVHAGDELGVVESVKAASDFYAPISGVISEINQAAADNPSIVNQDPYGKGWLVKIQPSNSDDIQDLLSAEDYEKEIAEDH